MVEFQDPGLRGGAAHAGGPGRYGAYTFSGTGVEVFGMKGPTITIDGRGHRIGTMRVSVDGKLKAEVPEHNGDFVYDCSLSKITGLADGNHVLQVEPEGGWIVVDYLAVSHATPASNPDPDPMTDVPTARRGKPGSGNDKPGASPGPKASGSHDAPAKHYLGDIPDGYYVLTPKHAPDMCLASTSGAPQDGDQLLISNPRQAATVVWHVYPTADYVYRISPATSPDEALTLPDSSSGQLPAILWKYSDYPTQKFQVRKFSSTGFCEIVLVGQANAVPAVKGNGKEASTPVVSVGWHGTDNQMWKLVPVPRGSAGTSQ